MPTAVLRRAASLLTHPLLPEDFLGTVNPLWSARQLRGVVEDVRVEARDAVSVTVRVPRGFPAHRAGQYVRVGVEVAGVRQWRTYSLTCPESRRSGRISFAVKRMGLVSDVLVGSTHPGDVLFLEPPQGDFVLPALPGPLLMLTGGSGITPVIGMLRTLVARGALRDVALVHSAPTPRDVLFADELAAYDRAFDGFRLIVRHTDTQGVLDLSDLDALVPDWTRREAFVCGPRGLLDAAEACWADRPELLHVERFAPTLLPGAGGEGGPVSYARSSVEVDADGTTSLLDAGEAAGVLMPSGCRMGICFGCVVPRTAGQVRDLRTGEVHEPDLVQTCISAAAGPVSIDV
jgi:ferredoxin-NADP reductase